MNKVHYDERNFELCHCPSCKVDQASECVQKRLLRETELRELPDKNEVARVYCASGAATCEGLDFEKQCQCPNCEVWYSYDIPTQYFCKKGAAEEIKD